MRKLLFVGKGLFVPFTIDLFLIRSTVGIWIANNWIAETSEKQTFSSLLFRCPVLWSLTFKWSQGTNPQHLYIDIPPLFHLLIQAIRHATYQWNNLWPELWVCGLNSKPLDDRTGLDHSNTKLVCHSDPLCIQCFPAKGLWTRP